MRCVGAHESVKTKRPVAEARHGSIPLIIFTGAVAQRRSLQRRTYHRADDRNDEPRTSDKRKLTVGNARRKHTYCHSDTADKTKYRVYGVFEKRDRPAQAAAVPVPVLHYGIVEVAHLLRFNILKIHAEVLIRKNTVEYYVCALIISAPTSEQCADKRRNERYRKYKYHVIAESLRIAHPRQFVNEPRRKPYCKIRTECRKCRGKKRGHKKHRAAPRKHTSCAQIQPPCIEKRYFLFIIAVFFGLTHRASHPLCNICSAPQKALRIPRRRRGEMRVFPLRLSCRPP